MSIELHSFPTGKEKVAATKEDSHLCPTEKELETHDDDSVVNEHRIQYDSMANDTCADLLAGNDPCDPEVESGQLVICYSGMDKTSLDTSSGSLFVRMSQDVLGCPRHFERNYKPLFGVAQSNFDLRYYVISRQIVI